MVESSTFGKLSYRTNKGNNSFLNTIPKTNQKSKMSLFNSSTDLEYET